MRCAHRAQQAAERLSFGMGSTDSGLVVVTTQDGRPMHPETLSGLFVRQAKQAGLPPIRLHDLRHSVASILLAAGTHPKVVSELLGHPSIGLTLDTYSHVIPSLAEEAAGVVAAAACMAPQPRPNRPIGPGQNHRFRFLTGSTIKDVSAPRWQWALILTSTTRRFVEPTPVPTRVRWPTGQRPR